MSELNRGDKVSFKISQNPKDTRVFFGTVVQVSATGKFRISPDNPAMFPQSVQFFDIKKVESKK